VKNLKALVALSGAAVICASGPADAGHVSVWVGPGWGYYPVVPVPYYYPPVVAVPSGPTQYVEQGQGLAQQGPADSAPSQSNGSWFYCDASKMYYPYAKACAGGWREVAAQPGPSD
jgi:hypothetical protein